MLYGQINLVVQVAKEVDTSDAIIPLEENTTIRKKKTSFPIVRPDNLSNIAGE